MHYKLTLGLQHRILRLLSFVFYRPEEYVLVHYLSYLGEARFRERGGRICRKNRGDKVDKELEELLSVRRTDLT